jgi:hypothetical protein
VVRDEPPGRLPRSSRSYRKHLFAVKRHDHLQQGCHNQLACLRRHMLGSCSPLSGWDGFRILVGLSLGEDPESGLREMAGDRTDGD